MICVSLRPGQLEQCQRDVAGLDLAEIRLDGLRKIDLDQIRAFFEQSNTPLIATCRPDQFDLTQRHEILSTAIEGGARYVDLELDAPKEFVTSLIALAGKKGCSVIVSHHDYQRTPAQSQLESIRNQCFSRGAQIAKIACMPNDMRDNIRLLSLLDCEQQVIAFGMGAIGRITRILGPLLGSPFTYASISGDTQTAPGQIVGTQLADVYQRIHQLLHNP